MKTNPLLTGNLFAFGINIPRANPVMECAKNYRIARQREKDAELALGRANAEDRPALYQNFLAAQKDADIASDAVLRAAENES